MKQKTNARQKRNEEALRGKEALSSGKKQVSVEASPAVSNEEETREFLAYLDKYGIPKSAMDSKITVERKSGSSEIIPRLNLEDGMPIVADALDRMRMGLQEMRYSRVKAVKLIHGYGSTGRSGKIRIVIQDELALLKCRKQIRDFVPGEKFGPTAPASQNLVEQNRNIRQDPDYGKMNRSITIVILF